VPAATASCNIDFISDQRGCGVKNRPVGIRLGPPPFPPWKLYAAMSPWTLPHHQSFSNPNGVFDSCLSFPGSPVDSQFMLAWPANARALQPPQLNPLRLIKSNAVISLCLAQIKRAPCIPADRRGASAGSRYRPVRGTFSVQPTCCRVWCACTAVVCLRHTRGGHDALRQPALPTILHRRAARHEEHRRRTAILINQRQPHYKSQGLINTYE
jgi:hypothetical protein